MRSDGCDAIGWVWSAYGMSETGGIRAVLICGPTASGKSAFALELAKESGGAVINADSMQVYADLRVITNRPTPEEEAAAPHRLYGFRPAREPYSRRFVACRHKRSAGRGLAARLAAGYCGRDGAIFQSAHRGLVGHTGNSVRDPRALAGCGANRACGGASCGACAPRS